MQVEPTGPGDPAALAAALSAGLDDPVGVVAAPGRVNLIGEHTDYNEGRCLPIALPHATYTAVGRRRDRRLTVTSRQRDERFEIDLDDLAPGVVTGWPAYVAGAAWALREAGHELVGTDLALDSTVPVGAGLSSSAALVCAAVTGLSLAAGADVAPADLVAPAVRAETDFVGAPTGGMDQTVSLLGRAAHALLIDVGEGTTRQVPWSPEREGLRLLAVDTRVSHALGDGGAYAARRADCEAAARLLGMPSLRGASVADTTRLPDARLRRRAHHVVTETERVGLLVDALDTADWPRVGELFMASHASLRDDFEVSCPELDVVVDTALAHGALGARMTGGGFGGAAIVLLREDDTGLVTDRVAAAFAVRGWPEPGVLPAPASRGAHRIG